MATANLLIDARSNAATALDIEPGFAGADDLVRNDSLESLRQDTEILTSQIGMCRETLANLTAAAGQAQATGGGRQRLEQFLDSIVVRCRAMRPEATIVCDWSGIAPAMDVLGEQSLYQALLVLLNNAVDASPEQVHVAADCYANTLRVAIEDRGSGVPTDNIEKLGKTFFTTKAPGKGACLGLVVASRAIERLRGSVRWASARDGGTRAEVVVPLDALQLRNES